MKRKLSASEVQFILDNIRELLESCTVETSPGKLVTTPVEAKKTLRMPTDATEDDLGITLVMG